MKSVTGFGDGRVLPFEESIWMATTPVRFAGTWFPHVMTILRLNAGDLLLHSPCAPSNEITSEIARLGAVRHVVAPNWFHDLFLKEYRKLYPEATFWGPHFLKSQHQATIDRVLDGGTITPWFDEMPHIALSGLLTFDECIFFHKPTRTLLVADLLMNAAAPPGAPPGTRLGYRIFGLSGQLKVFPIVQWFGFTAKASLRSAASHILEWEPKRLLVGHGTPIYHDAMAHLRYAFNRAHLA